MTLAVHLLGRPRLEHGDGDGYQFRSRKSWALLAHLILGERPPGRARLASLLFGGADDPLRALRWSLAEIRRGLGADGTVDGDPVRLELVPGTTVDVRVLAHGAWPDAVLLPGLGSALLEGSDVRAGAAFESWLLSQRRRLAAASEAILHEAALGSASAGAFDTALAYAVRAAELSPLDENHQALLIRLYRLAGDDAGAQRQYDACRELLQRELGVAPGIAVRSALRDTRPAGEPVADEASVEAVLEAGVAAVSAGAVEAGVGSLRTAVRLADAADADRLRVEARLVLAEALVHSLRGMDEEGLAALYEADRIGSGRGDRDAVARARAELGYVDYLRARYDRAEHWFSQALELAGGTGDIAAKAVTYLGAVDSDRGEYDRAAGRLERGIRLSRDAARPRLEAFGLAMLGRVHLLRGRWDAAAGQLDASIEAARAEHWLAFLPWPQAMRGQVQLAGGDVDGAAETLRQAFARACQLGDPCWEGMAGLGLAMVAEARGDTDRAFATLADARARTNRLADPYVWLDVHILDAQCELGRRHGHPETARWVATMRRLAARTGMRELAVRSARHGAALGHDGDAVAGPASGPGNS